MNEVTFLKLVLNSARISQAECGRKLGWSEPRIAYLCSPECDSFPFKHLWHLKDRLKLSDHELLLLLKSYFESKVE